MSAKTAENEIRNHARTNQRHTLRKGRDNP